MLEALQFAKGAVAKKDFVPALQYFRIAGGFIRAYNGVLGLCSPIGIDLDCAPKADQLVRAIDNCADPVVLSLNDKGRLLVKSGKFKTFVDTTDPTAFPPYEPLGNRVKLAGPILPALRYLEPFIAEDASRQWACGILFYGKSAFATNNIVLIEFYLGADFPCRVNIPGMAIRELLRIGIEPTAIQMAENRVTFHFEEGRWLTTNLYETQWPDTEPLLSKISVQSIFTGDFFTTLERLSPFCDDLGRVYFHKDRLSTSAEPDLSGTTFDLPGIPALGCYNIRQLIRLNGIAETIDFTCYPQPSIFYGGDARGLIVGLRQ